MTVSVEDYTAQADNLDSRVADLSKLLNAFEAANAANPKLNGQLLLSLCDLGEQIGMAARDATKHLILTMTRWCQLSDQQRKQLKLHHLIEATQKQAT